MNKDTRNKNTRMQMGKHNHQTNAINMKVKVNFIINKVRQGNIVEEANINKEDREQ